MKKLLLLLVALPLFAFAQKTPQGVTYDAQILKVNDGDTIVIAAPFLPAPLKPQLAVRVFGVDTPEKGFRAKCEAENQRGLAASEFTKNAVAKSIKMTTVKPSGTVSILAGESPGVHWTPGGQYFLRAIRFSNEDPMLPLFTMANYTVEPASESPTTTSVVFFPVESMAKRSEKDVTIFEKMSLASMAQRHWSDNSVSVTVSFNQETEGEHVGTVLHMFDGQLKTVSFLPMGNTIYPQMPYTQITKQDYEEYVFKLMPIDFAGVYAGLAADAIGEAYCTTDACEISFIKKENK